MNIRKDQLRKYFIMGSQNCSRNPVAILQEAIHAGITAFQYREKGDGARIGAARLALGKQLRQLCKEHQVLFIVNDDLELAEKLQADGIHVGQSDTHVTSIRKRFPNKVIGLSVSNQQELDSSPLPYINYLGAGPIYRTTTKTDAKKAVGTKWIQSLRNQVPDHPIVGIGGITANNAAAVMTAGADGVCVISAITHAKNIHSVVQHL